MDNHHPEFDTVDRELFRLVDALGAPSKSGVFSGSPRLLSSLRGLDYMLHRDNAEFQPAYERIGRYQLVSSHFLPILLTYRNDRSIVYALVRLFVRLTMPLKSILEDRVMDRIRHLQQMKCAFLEGECIYVLMSHLVPLISLFPTDRTQEDQNFLELLLTFIRNLLLIPDPLQNGLHQDLYESNIQDRLILKYHSESVLEMLVLAAQNVQQEKQFQLILLECFAQLFRQDTAEELALAMDQEAVIAADANMQPQQSVEGQSQADPAAKENVPQPSAAQAKKPAAAHSNPEKERLLRSLQLSCRTNNSSLHQLKKESGSRHGRFGTRIVDVGLNSSNERAGATKIIRNVFSDPAAVPSDKLAQKSGKRPKMEAARRVYLNSQVRRVLWDTALQLVESGGFNLLQRAIQNEFESAATNVNTQLQDELHFMQLSAICMGVWRLRKKPEILAACKAVEGINAEEKRKWKEMKAKFEEIHENKLKEARLMREEREAEVKQAFERELEEETKELEVEKSKMAAEKERFDDTQRRIKNEIKEIKAVYEIFPTGSTAAAASSGESMSVEDFFGAAESEAAAPRDDDEEAEASIEPDRRAPEIEYSESDRARIAELESELASADHAHKVAIAHHDAFLLQYRKRQAERVERINKFQREHKRALLEENMPFNVNSLPPVIVHPPAASYNASPIEATLTVDSFKFLNRKILSFMEEKPIPWSALGVAIAMYKEILRNTYEMYQYGDEKTRETAEYLRKSIFYDKESVELFPQLVKTFERHKNSLRFMSDLVLCVHYSMKLFSAVAKNGEKIILHTKKKRMVKRKKKKNENQNEGDEGEMGEGEEGQVEAEAEGEEAGAKKTSKPKSQKSKKNRSLHSLVGQLIPSEELLDENGRRRLEISLNQKRQEQNRINRSLLERLADAKARGIIVQQQVQHWQEQLEAEQRVREAQMRRLKFWLSHFKALQESDPSVGDADIADLHSQIDAVEYRRRLASAHHKQKVLELQEIESEINSQTQPQKSFEAAEPGLATPAAPRTVALTASPSPGGVAYQLSQTLSISMSDSAADSSLAEVSQIPAIATCSTIESLDVSIQPVPGSIEHDAAATEGAGPEGVPNTSASLSDPMDLSALEDPAYELEAEFQSRLDQEKSQLQSLQEKVEEIEREIEEDRERARAAKEKAQEAPAAAEAESIKEGENENETGESQEDSEEPLANKKKQNAEEGEAEADNTEAKEGEGQAEGANKSSAAASGEGEGDDEYEEVEEEVEEDVQMDYHRRELELDLDSYVARYAHPHVIQRYCYLLENYFHNNSEVNHCVIRLFERLIDDHKLVAMFFQLQVLLMFDVILQDSAIKVDKAFNELRALCKRVVKAFFEAAAKNRVLFVEALFWKTAKVARSIMGGYQDVIEERRLAMADARDNDEWAAYDDAMWSDQKIEDDEGLQALFQGNRELQDQIRIEEAGDGLAEFQRPRSDANEVLMSAAKQRAKLSQQEEEGEAELEVAEWDDDDGEGMKRKRRPWTPEEDATLRAEFPNFAELDYAEIIASILNTRTADEVERRIKKLGLKQTLRENKREKRKSEKKEKKAKRKINYEGESSEQSQSEQDENDEENENGEQPAEAAKSKAVAFKAPDLRLAASALESTFRSIAQSRLISSARLLLEQLQNCRDERSETRSFEEHPIKPAEWEGYNREFDSHLQEICTALNFTQAEQMDESNDSESGAAPAWSVPKPLNARQMEGICKMVEKLVKKFAKEEQMTQEEEEQVDQEQDEEAEDDEFAAALAEQEQEAEADAEQPEQADPEESEFRVRLRVSLRSIITAFTSDELVGATTKILKAALIENHGFSVEELDENKAELKELAGSMLVVEHEAREKKAEKERQKAEQERIKAERAAEKERMLAEAREREARKKAEREVAQRIARERAEERASRKRKQQEEAEEKEKEKSVRLEDQLEDSSLAEFLKRKKARAIASRKTFETSQTNADTNANTMSPSQPEGSKRGGRLRRMRRDESDSESSAPSESSQPDNEQSTMLDDSFSSQIEGDGEAAETQTESLPIDTLDDGDAEETAAVRKPKKRHTARIMTDDNEEGAAMELEGLQSQDIESY